MQIQFLLCTVQLFHSHIHARRLGNRPVAPGLSNVCMRPVCVVNSRNARTQPQIGICHLELHVYRSQLKNRSGFLRIGIGHIFLCLIFTHQSASISQKVNLTIYGKNSELRWFWSEWIQRRALRMDCLIHSIHRFHSIRSVDLMEIHLRTIAATKARSMTI